MPSAHRPLHTARKGCALLMTLWRRPRDTSRPKRSAGWPHAATPTPMTQRGTCSPAARCPPVPAAADLCPQSAACLDIGRRSPADCCPPPCSLADHPPHASTWGALACRLPPPQPSSPTKPPSPTPTRGLAGPHGASRGLSRSLAGAVLGSRWALWCPSPPTLVHTHHVCRPQRRCAQSRVKRARHRRSGRRAGDQSVRLEASRALAEPRSGLAGRRAASRRLGRGFRRFAGPREASRGLAIAGPRAASRRLQRLAAAPTLRTATPTPTCRWGPAKSKLHPRT